MVGRFESDRARTGCLRGINCDAGPGGAAGDVMGGEPLRSGEFDREFATEELADDPESGISVKPNNFGLLPRFCVICNESAAMAIVRRGGDRTSGKTCRGTGIVRLELLGGEGIRTAGSDPTEVAETMPGDCRGILLDVEAIVASREGGTLSLSGVGG